MKKASVKLIAVIIFGLLWGTTAYGHAGEGDPIFARVEVPDQIVYPGDSMRVIFHVFDLKALETGHNEEPLAEPEVTVIVEKGDEKITTSAMQENGLYVADLKFPEAGKWKLSAHVERPKSTHHEDQESDHDQEQTDNDEASIEPHDSEDTTYFQTTITVRYGFEKIAPLWAWVTTFVLVMAGLFLIRKIRKKAK